MTNELAITRPENVDLITRDIPTVYQDSQTSHSRCLAAGSNLLQQIQQYGMTDELDQKCALFIEKARKTVAKINGMRTPYTKLFDDFRSQFTKLENGVDPSKKDSIPYQIQQLRNEFAAKKRAEEEELRRQAMIEQQRTQAIATYRSDMEREYDRIFNNFINAAINEIIRINNSCTLDNYDASVKRMSSIKEQLPETFITSARITVPIPVNVTEPECSEIRSSVLESMMPTFRNKYLDTVYKTKVEYLAMMPSRKEELTRAAQASAEEAERIRKQIEQRDLEEQARKKKAMEEEQERERQAALLAKQQADMIGAFDQSAATMAVPDGYKPKSSVKKRIQVNSPSGFMQLINFWWINVGQSMTVDELANMFKKQVTFAEKMANDKNSPEFINDPSIVYVEEIKAK